MCIEFVALNHIKWNGAVGKQHLACFGVYLRRIGLESRNAKQRIGNSHRQHCRHITLATCHYTLGIKTSQSKAAGIVNCRKQIETSKCETLQLVFIYNHLQTLIDTIGHFTLLNLSNTLNKLFDRNFYQIDAKLCLNGFRIGSA